MGKTAEKIEAVALKLFAERGYEGTSVRAICEAAGTNVNAVSYHFGGKQALYTAIVDRYSSRRLDAAARIVGEPPRDLADFETRLHLYAEELLASYLAAPELLIVMFAEWQQGFRNYGGGDVTEKLVAEGKLLTDFLTKARHRRLLRKGVDPAIVAGALFERLSNQVRYAEAIEAVYGVSVADPAYRRHWIKQTVDLLLFGAARPKEE